MEQDEIIREVRAIREAYAERFGFDIRALYRDAKEREGKSQRPVVTLAPKLLKRDSVEESQSPGARR